ncbi:TetR/AcrR family transcriptional regulator [Enterobacter bugandensis]|uniref:TetR/AcrR family transcriptional regulator n=1 Tax=Enterobacter bugandensis TaxID=881260 RepID=UPI000751084B|nr:TetR/AcrR family transcriptional regulator [Enterobacter bugandensis]KUQ57034.1 hypothetical protein AWI22_03135 [Enterobacter bugandensis]
MRNTKMKIISAANNIFNESGYISPSIEKIAQAGDVSKMTFYKYFPDKESLITEVLSIRKTAFLSEIAHITSTAATPRLKLKGIFDYYASWIAGPGFNGCMFSRAVTELGATSPLILQINDELKTELVQTITDVLKEAIEPEPAERLALTIMILIDGAIIASLSPSMTREYLAIDLAWIAAKSLVLAESKDF